MLFLDDDLLLMILKHGCADRAVDIARKCGAGGGTVMTAKGSATKGILAALGLGESTRDLVFCVLGKETALKVMDAVTADPKVKGVAALLCGGIECKEADCMEAKWKMITVIANSGCAEDIMDAARKAGARGGTVTNARGTADPADDNFWGITIVPEKEMILILTESSNAKAIADAISGLDCLQERGAGVLFMQDVTDFRNVGEMK